MEYYYERYRMSNYDLSKFDGPRAGVGFADVNDKEFDVGMLFGRKPVHPADRVG